MKTIISVSFMLLLVVLSGCNVKPEKPSVHWTNIELKDINSGEIYKLSDYKGKKILFETFSVWCVNCKNQQDKIKELNDDGVENLVIVSLSSDPNEDEEAIKKYINENGYTWHYSIAPKELTEQLMQEFGFVILNAANTPIVLFCEDGSYSLLPDGLKGKEDLLNAVNSC